MIPDRGADNAINTSRSKSTSRSARTGFTGLTGFAPLKEGARSARTKPQSRTLDPGCFPGESATIVLLTVKPAIVCPSRDTRRLSIKSQFNTLCATCARLVYLDTELCQESTRCRISQGDVMRRDGPWHRSLRDPPRRLSAMSSPSPAQEPDRLCYSTNPCRPTFCLDRCILVRLEQTGCKP